MTIFDKIQASMLMIGACMFIAAYVADNPYNQKNWVPFAGIIGLVLFLINAPIYILRLIWGW